jgi:glycosyltransferase involved in cell wall biosynthesis
MLSEKWTQKPHQIGRRIKHRLRQSGLLGKYDLVFVVDPGNRGWILDAICREIAAYFPGRYCFHYSTTRLPPAKAYFFSHYSLLPLSARANPQLWQSQLLVWYTHPRPEGELKVSYAEIYGALNRATKVICTCSSFVDYLHTQGVAAEKTTFLLGGADPAIFQPHDRHNGAIGFCTAYYARKSPDLILDIVKQMPHRQFLLLGRNWQQYERFAELKALPNFSYVEAPYADYPRYYAAMDVFVSPAKLEGGPIPLLEAMMSNIVPVASRTGFAPDLIRPGENGFLFDTDSSAAEVCALIEQALTLPADVRSTVEHLSWRNFSQGIQALLAD